MNSNDRCAQLNRMNVFRVQQQNPFDSLIEAARIFGQALDTASQTAAAVGEAVDAVGKTTFRATQPYIEQATQETGQFLFSVSQNSLLKFFIDRLGADWLRTLLGEVEIEKIQQQVNNLQREHPYETPEQIAHRIAIEKAISAGGLGLATNIVPPVAIALLGLELATLFKLQAEMIYQIAAVYELDLFDPARRGEVLAVLSLVLGSSGFFKGGLGIIELIPLIGAFYAATTNAAMLYTTGNIANRYYEAKLSLVSASVS